MYVCHSCYICLVDNEIFKLTLGSAQWEFSSMGNRSPHMVHKRGYELLYSLRTKFEVKSYFHIIQYNSRKKCTNYSNKAIRSGLQQIDNQ